MFITDDRIWATGRKAGGYWGSASLAWRFEQAVISATASAAAVTPADQGRHPAAALVVPGVTRCAGRLVVAGGCRNLVLSLVHRGEYAER